VKDYATYVASELRSHAEIAARAVAELEAPITAACELVTARLAAGNKLIVFGNGGSAADAQHIAAELTGRYETHRRALPAIALTTDTSALTAIANDFGYEQVFARQVEALARAGDVVLAISTSGNSTNVNLAIERARDRGCKVIGLTGKGGGTMAGRCDVTIVVPADVTSRIQEVHITVGHILCGAVDRWAAEEA
jgi:D-sedoheptulose 7-phosphate isomerase